MAHHKSAKKRIRRTQRRTVINRVRLSRVRSAIKAVELAIEGGDKAAAAAALHEAEPRVMRGVRKGVIVQNTASRRISRMAHRIKKMP
jgi:small subunit ribosomal protein S20